MEILAAIMSNYHEPVLLKESIDMLITNPEGIYVDVTFGGGGHSGEILSRLTSKGKLIVFDQDEDAQRNIPEDYRLIFLKSNFRHLYRFWKWLDIQKIDGLLADLGVSSHQFDVKERGFAYRFDSELDMRMNANSALTAAEVLNGYAEEDLVRMFSEYGEVRNARKLAREIVAYRKSASGFSTTAHLNSILERIKVGDRNKYFAQVYQALRIEVNDEMLALREMLEGAKRILKPGGRLVVISYHSIEDRMVKRFFKTGNFKGELKKDMYGNSLSELKMIKNLIVPDSKEQEVNPRSRSAKMRIAEKLS